MRLSPKFVQVATSHPAGLCLTVAIAF